MHVSANINNCISFSQKNQTRSNLCQLDKFRARLDVRKIFIPIELFICGILYVIVLSHALYYEQFC